MENNLVVSNNVQNLIIVIMHFFIINIFQTRNGFA